MPDTELAAKKGGATAPLLLLAASAVSNQGRLPVAAREIARSLVTLTKGVNAAAARREWAHDYAGEAETMPLVNPDGGAGLPANSPTTHPC